MSLDHDATHTLLLSEFSACHSAVETNTGNPAMLALASLLLSSDTSHPHPGELASLFTKALSDPTATCPGLCALGHIFASGVHVSPSHIRAVSLWQRCAFSNDCILARFFLAQAFHEGLGVQPDVAKAAHLFQEVADKTKSNAARVRLARLLEFGADGFQADPKRAVSMYCAAIRDGESIEAMECLADLFLDGRDGVEEDPRAAVRLYEQAIQWGASTRAMNSLALLLETGAEGVMRMPRRAITLYQRAISEGNDEAMANLASLLSRGADGVERDIEKAAALYERAVEYGNIFAMRNLAHMIVNGEGAVEQDLYRAMELYEEVLRDGRYECGRVKVNLAWLLSCHQDVLPQDVIRAAKLYEEVIEEEVNACAMYNLAGLLAEGRGGLKRDVHRAVELYQRAIEEDEDAFSMHNLGLLLSSDTEGVEKQLDRAIELLDRAAGEGLREAEFDLALLLTGGDGDEALNDSAALDLERGMQLYNDLIDDLDHMGAIINLSELYGEGKFGVPKDVKKAMQLSERAIAVAFENDEEQLSELGIAVDDCKPLRQDLESVDMREHAVAQRWHLVAMCNLAELLLMQDSAANLERAVKLILKALSDSRASRALRCLTFTDLLSGLKRAIRSSTDVKACKMVATTFEVIVGRIGNTQAMCLLAEMLMTGAPGVRRDVKKAVSLYKRAVFNEDTRAMLRLGELLSNGAPGIGVDIGKAVESLLQVFAVDPSCEEAHEAAVNVALLHTRRRRCLDMSR